MSIKMIGLAGILLFLGACGFTPMYASGGNGDAVAGLNRVEIAVIPDEEGIALRNALIDRFYADGYPTSPTHKLIIAPINELERDLDITVESEATRKQIKLTTTLALVDNASGDAVLTRTLIAITSYNVSPTQFSTRVSENDARDAALSDLARQIETQVSLYFKR